MLSGLKTKAPGSCGGNNTAYPQTETLHSVAFFAQGAVGGYCARPRQSQHYFIALVDGEFFGQGAVNDNFTGLIGVGVGLS